MRKKHFLLFSVLLFLCIEHGFGQDSFVDGVELTTIKSPWTMKIVGNDLDITDAKAKPDQASAYFMMTSRSSGLNVSVFIEPIDKCKSGDECRDYVLGVGNPAWGKYQDLAKGKIKDFSYFEFFRPEAQGLPLKMFDMYAQYVSQGFWVDVHISKVSYKKEDHALFEKVINSISFVPKGEGRAGVLDTQRAKAEKSNSAWLDLWDNVKCRESFVSLSAVTKKEITEKLWVEWCTTVNTSLGKNKSRKPIAAAFTRSLPPKTDRPLGVLVYLSDFPKREALVEIVAVLLEKDGTWSVTNYITR